MKYLKYITSVFFFVLMAGMMTSCEDEEEFSFEELRNEEFDLQVVSSSEPYINVAFSIKSSGIKMITVTATLDGDNAPTGTTTLSNITANSLSRLNVKIAFPASNEAPSGLYTISYSVETNDGAKDGGSYVISVINNIPPAFCPYDEPLPSGKTVWVKVYLPTSAQMADNDKTLYATGSFEGWSGGGNPANAFTAISPTCYVLALNLASGDALKITRGEWSKEVQGYNKSNFSDFIYAGQSSIEFAVYDFGDTDFDLSAVAAPSVPLAIPAGAIVPGKMTVVAQVTNFDVKSGKYYVVKEGATSLTGAVEMIAFESLNYLAAAVAKDDGVNYVVVKDEATAEGTNAYGFAPEIMWDGETNPVQVPIGSFGDPIALPASLYMTGSATDGWAGGGSFEIPSIADGIYQATFTINGDSEYLLLPSPGDWDNKWGFGGTGNSSSGSLSSPGSGNNISTSGLTTGSYKIVVDFTVGTGTYTLTEVAN